MIKKFLDFVYNLDIVSDVEEFYDDWVFIYDVEVIDNGYFIFFCCVDVLWQFLFKLEIKILDVGCGIGFFGEVLVKVGYINIDGIDLLVEMFVIVKCKGVYKFVIYMQGEEMEIESGSYEVIVCIGVIGVGVVFVFLLDMVMNLLFLGGKFVLFYNDKVIKECIYEVCLNDYFDGGSV